MQCIQTETQSKMIHYSTLWPQPILSSPLNPKMDLAWLQVTHFWILSTLR